MNFKSFVNSYCLIFTTIFGLVGTLVTILLVPGSTSVPNGVAIVLIVLFLSLIILSIMSVSKLKKLYIEGTRYGVVLYDKDEDNQEFYYVKYTENLRYGTLVTIYYDDPAIEQSRTLGYGIVNNPSVGQYVEIKVRSVCRTEMFEKSKTNNKKVLNHLYVLPNVYVDQLPKITNSVL